MSKKRFTWENFPYDFLKAIAYGKDISYICGYPDDYFVRKYRKSIEDYFLNGSNHLIQVVRRLERLNYGGIHLGENDEMLFALRQKRMTQTLCDVYLSELRMTGKAVYNDEESVFQLPK